MAEEIVLTGPKTTLQEDLTRLYSQGFLTDITLSTEDGKNFEAHRILLAARSHYFHSIGKNKIYKYCLLDNYFLKLLRLS